MKGREKDTCLYSSISDNVDERGRTRQKIVFLIFSPWIENSRGFQSSFHRHLHQLSIHIFYTKEFWYYGELDIFGRIEWGREKTDYKIDTLITQHNRYYNSISIVIIIIMKGDLLLLFALLANWGKFFLIFYKHSLDQNCWVMQNTIFKH